MASNMHLRINNQGNEIYYQKNNVFQNHCSSIIIKIIIISIDTKTCRKIERQVLPSKEYRPRSDETIPWLSLFTIQTIAFMKEIYMYLENSIFYDSRGVRDLKTNILYLFYINNLPSPV